MLVHGELIIKRNHMAIPVGGTDETISPAASLSEQTKPNRNKRPYR
jgi:hypothetical protein